MSGSLRETIPPQCRSQRSRFGSGFHSLPALCLALETQGRKSEDFLGLGCQCTGLLLPIGYLQLHNLGKVPQPGQFYARSKPEFKPRWATSMIFRFSASMSWPVASKDSARVSIREPYRSAHTRASESLAFRQMRAPLAGKQFPATPQLDLGSCNMPHSPWGRRLANLNS